MKRDGKGKKIIRKITIVFAVALLFGTMLYVNSAETEAATTKLHTFFKEQGNELGYNGLFDISQYENAAAHLKNNVFKKLWLLNLRKVTIIETNVQKLTDRQSSDCLSVL